MTNKQIFKHLAENNWKIVITYLPTNVTYGLVYDEDGEMLAVQTVKGPSNTLSAELVTEALRKNYGKEIKKHDEVIL